MNHDSAAQDLALSFADVPGLQCCEGQCSVRDVWARKSLGAFTGSYTAKGVGSHDCAFFVLEAACAS